MSVEATRAVWRFSEAKGTARLILLAIADNADDGGYAWPGHDHIAEKCRISVRSVIDNIKTLEASGELGVRHRRNLGNVYLISLGDLPALHEKAHRQRSFKCRFCILPNVKDGASNVQNEGANMQIRGGNVKAAAHEPSVTAFESPSTKGEISERRKANPDCEVCGDQPYDCLRCSNYANRGEGRSA